MENQFIDDSYEITPYDIKLKIKAKRLSSSAKIPTYGTPESACCDLYANIEENSHISILPHTTAKIGTGWAFQPPVGYCGLIFARSGLATKQGLRPANCVGVCDGDYTGEYIVAVHNDSEQTQYIKNGDRIAQLIFLPFIQSKFIEVEELNNTDRGSGGFGSTGK